ncbi:MAG: ribosome biogenesis GTPase YlqF [Clostridia bacterium]|nr:ribosome biogenesis GTPase YlqF [Clostridia bacterium]
MEKINWFPGHMAKAIRMMQEEVKSVDAIIYVLDARAPLACVNPSFISVIGNKPILYVLNKIDLADITKIRKVEGVFRSENSNFLEMNSSASGALKKVTNALNELCKKQIDKFKNKGINYFVKAMVIGVPNSGKSTLVNNLCGRAKATTGNKPGVTKGKQCVRLTNNIELMDTPGVLWPDLSNEENARQLAYIGSISENVISSADLSIFLIKDLLRDYPNAFKERFGLLDEEIKDLETYEILELIGKKRKYVVKGGEIDYDRAALVIIDDFRKGKMGKMTFLSGNKKYE